MPTSVNDYLYWEFNLIWVMNVVEDCTLPASTLIDPIVLDGTNSAYNQYASHNMMFVDCSGVTGDGANWSEDTAHNAVSAVGDVVTIEINGSDSVGSWFMNINGGTVPADDNNVCGPEVITAISASGIDS